MEGSDNEVRFSCGEGGQVWAIGIGGRMLHRVEEEESKEKAGS